LSFTSQIIWNACVQGIDNNNDDNHNDHDDSHTRTTTTTTTIIGLPIYVCFAKSMPKIAPFSMLYKTLPMKAVKHKWSTQEIVERVNKRFAMAKLWNNVERESNVKAKFKKAITNRAY
jgi:hypothetical protein